MCDDFGPTLSEGRVVDDDSFPLSWHPHRGQDILTYITRGKSRHGDSLGNREEFDSPGMQWISVGSGIEHAEGGGTPAGEYMHGFQIWINVPSDRKLDDPRYGTDPPENIPLVNFGEGGQLGYARVLAGPLPSTATHVRGPPRGPFTTVSKVQMLDVTLLSTNDQIEVVIPPLLDNVLVYVYDGSAMVNDELVMSKQVMRLEPSGTDELQRTLYLQGSGSAATEDKGFGTGHFARLMIFAGKRLNQPIAWHGLVFLSYLLSVAQWLWQLKMIHMTLFVQIPHLFLFDPSSAFVTYGKAIRHDESTGTPNSDGRIS